MHDSITATDQWLNLLLKGHLSYFAVSAIAQAYGDSSMRYAGFGCVRFGGAEGVPELGGFIRLTGRFFPPIKILHPQPLHRFDARTLGRSPVR